MNLFAGIRNAQNSSFLFQADLQVGPNDTMISCSKVDYINSANVNGSLHPGKINSSHSETFALFLNVK